MEMYDLVGISVYNQYTIIIIFI